MPIMVAQNPDDNRKKTGLVDGEMYDFECNVCGKFLLQAKVTRPESELEAIYKCKCPYCLDKKTNKSNFSNGHFIKGGIHLIGHAELDKNGNEVPKTMPRGDYEVLSDGTVIIPVIKV